MAIRLQSKANVIAPGGAYPYGRIKDNPGDGTGTPVNENVYGDFHQFFAKLLADASITGNDLPENSTNTFQYILALNAKINTAVAVETTARGVAIAAEVTNRNAAIAAAILETWVDISSTLNAGWSQVSGSNTFSYKFKVGGGIVFKGYVQKGSSTGSLFNICPTPSALVSLLPSGGVSINCYSGNGLGTRSGGVIIISSTNITIALDASITTTDIFVIFDGLAFYP